MPTFKPYPPELLPPGFTYPGALLHFASDGEPPQIAPWWFIDASSRAGQLAFSVRTHDGRNLVPFAKVDDGRGDLACFDGDDASGDPEVLMLVLDEAGRKYSFANFDAWFEAVRQEAALLRIEQELLGAEHVLNTQYSFDLAEPYYTRCLADIQAAPSLQPKIEALVLTLFAAKRLTDEPVAYLMHKLRWHGVRQWMEKTLREMPHAIAEGSPYEKVLASYDDDWDNKRFYQFL